MLNIRDQRVLLDVDLARLYGVETRVLNQAVKRNQSRFPAEFVFQLTDDEFFSISKIVTYKAALTSQTVMSKPGRGGRRPALRCQRFILCFADFMQLFPAFVVQN
ncbi:MAG TPA: ORF6N domain-containing protein [Verrucomicrobiae bacterium]|nr:ORF6N domain-containing protein [Verrucomicrobiae bacterium]